MYSEIGVLHVCLYKCSISQILYIYMYLHVKMEENIEMLECGCEDLHRVLCVASLTRAMIRWHVESLVKWFALPL